MATSMAPLEARVFGLEMANKAFQERRIKGLRQFKASESLSVATGHGLIDQELIQNQMRSGSRKGLWKFPTCSKCKELGHKRTQCKVCSGPSQVTTSLTCSSMAFFYGDTPINPHTSALRGSGPRPIRTPILHVSKRRSLPRTSRFYTCSEPPNSTVTKTSC